MKGRAGSRGSYTPRTDKAFQLYRAKQANRGLKKAQDFSLLCNSMMQAAGRTTQHCQDGGLTRRERGKEKGTAIRAEDQESEEGCFRIQMKGYPLYLSWSWSFSFSFGFYFKMLQKKKSRNLAGEKKIPFFLCSLLYLI